MSSQCGVGEPGQERRANVRLNRVLAISVSDGQGAFCSAVAVDLSVSGFQIATSFGLSPGELVDFRLHLRSMPVVEGTAEVVWCEELELGLYRIGCQFEEMRNESDFQRLLDFVDREHLNAGALPPEADPTLGLSAQLTLRGLSENELDRLSVVARIAEILNGAYELQELLDITLRITVEATGAERGIVLLDRGGEDFESPSFFTVSPATHRGFSRCVVDKVLSTGQALLSLDAQRDERLAASSSLRVMGTRSVLCIPITTRDRHFGMIYLDSSVRAGVLTQSDLRLGTVIAGMAASALERAESFAMMVQREKMAAIGTLTAGIIHELNNPLASILGLGELIHLEAPGELTEDLLSEAQRCRRLVQDLLRLSRQEPMNLGAVALPEVIMSALSVVRPRAEALGVELVVETEPELPTVQGSADHLRQVVLNLVVNALSAVGRGPGGRIEIKVQKGKDLLLTVADNGPGIAAAHMERLFDPFFTTKSPEEGTGLGLCIIARIVSEHGGTVTARNRPEGGAIFTVFLPLGDLRQAVNA